jgi:Eukaryotic aspartyl protease
MGMAFQSLTADDSPPHLISEGVLTSPMFGFNLASSGPELFLGGVNPAYDIDEFTWVAVPQEVCHIFECVSFVGH